ncbi:phage tail assembly chaperone G [Enterococcus gallinarum]|uniref:phage tail assembly chaperone G n=1 Tax=Enterococcus gallinarum TaxID=1353 RepID=UPI0039199E66
MTEIKLTLRMKDGKTKTFTQDFVPFKKRLDYVREETELVERTDRDGKPMPATSEELTEFRANFVAGLFNDKQVTGDAILNGVDVEDPVIMDIILYRVLGLRKEEISEENDEKKEV